MLDYDLNKYPWRRAKYRKKKMKCMAEYQDKLSDHLGRMMYIARESHNGHKKKDYKTHKKPVNRYITGTI